MEDCLFGVDNTDLSDSIDEDFKMVAVSVAPAIVHLSPLNLLDYMVCLIYEWAEHDYCNNSLHVP